MSCGNVILPTSRRDFLTSAGAGFERIEDATEAIVGKADAGEVGTHGLPPLP